MASLRVDQKHIGGEITQTSNSGVLFANISQDAMRSFHSTEMANLQNSSRTLHRKGVRLGPSCDTLSYISGTQAR
jgi:hypothetical protein